MTAASGEVKFRISDEELNQSGFHLPWIENRLWR